jgi:hypothetical protein
LTFTRWELREPFDAKQSGPPRRGLGCCVARLAVAAAFAGTKAAPRRYFLPTYATDSRYEHSQTVRFLSIQLSLTFPRAVLKSIQGCHASLDDLAVIRASGGRAFDDAVQLRANHAQRHLLKGGSSTAPGDAALPRRFQPCARLCDLTSDAPHPVSRNAVTRRPTKP